MPSFGEFYEALNGWPPFPWQARLARQVAEEEKWPSEVGVPTGLGKTACLEVAIWWLASQAERAPTKRSAPTRIWWLVNRRLLVDSTFEHARMIAQAMAEALRPNAPNESKEAVRAVAQRLRELGSDPDSRPLEVIRLRGGVSSRRPMAPSQPAVILSTIPMYGSRLLFRGYGTSSMMRPVDAALAGVDSLVLVDEAHLAHHLIALIPTLDECWPARTSVLPGPRARPQVVALTATGDAHGDNRFDIDEQDHANETIRRRLDAAKPLEVRDASGKIDLRLAEAVKTLLAHSRDPAACLVFANTPTTARSVFQRLRKGFTEHQADILLLTGRAREREATRTRDRILDRTTGMLASRDVAAVRQRHLIVVATQTLEVGADIDAEYLVTEACGVRALTQRLGRLNRLGRFPHARAVYVHVPPRRRRGQKEAQWPVYGSEPATVLGRLQAHLDPATGSVSLSPGSVAGALGEPQDDPGRSPEILRGILWEWLKTTTPPQGEAPVEPYFSGISAADYSVSVVWRAHIPDEGRRLWPRASDREAVAVPLRDVRSALGDDPLIFHLASDGRTVTSATDVEDLRPGQVILLPCDRGLLDQFGWSATAKDHVVDMSVVEHGVPLDAAAIRRLYRGVSGPTDGMGDPIRLALGEVDDHDDIDPEDQQAAVEEIRSRLAAVPAGMTEEEWHAMVSSLGSRVVTARNEVPRLVRHREITNDPYRDASYSDELDETSLLGKASESDAVTDLALHGRAVGARCRSIAQRVGVSPDLLEMVAMAGEFHDVGKADRRFQRWLDSEGTRPNPIAKSNMPRSLWRAARVRAGWPSGGRHEDLSVRLVRRWLEDEAHQLSSCQATLVLHLIASHHGNGRPVTPPAVDDTTLRVRAVIRGSPVERPADLSTIDWDQPSRFRRLNNEFGPWGLAFLETLVRQADHAVSAGSRVWELEASQ